MCTHTHWVTYTGNVHFYPCWFTVLKWYEHVCVCVCVCVHASMHVCGMNLKSVLHWHSHISVHSVACGGQQTDGAISGYCPCMHAHTHTHSNTHTGRQTDTHIHTHTHWETHTHTPPKKHQLMQHAAHKLTSHNVPCTL